MFLSVSSSSSLVKGTSSWNSYDAFVESQELVLDVVPGDKVVLKRKVGHGGRLSKDSGCCLCLYCWCFIHKYNLTIYSPKDFQVYWPI